MATTSQALSRKFFLDVFACGVVEIRKRGQHNKGGLPVFSTDTHEQAQALQVLFCKLERDSNDIYRLNPDLRPSDVGGLGTMVLIRRLSA